MKIYSHGYASCGATSQISQNPMNNFKFRLSLLCLRFQVVVCDQSNFEGVITPLGRLDKFYALNN